MGFKVTPTELEGVVIIEPPVFADERGFFLETYHKTKFADLGLPTDFVQDNHSRSAHGVVRGLHYQDLRTPQAKLVRCSIGKILDVAVDLRVGAPTFGRWIAVELSAENFRQLLIPVGFGHGFAVLSDAAEVQYRCTGVYDPASEGAVRWNDPEIGIDWPLETPILSQRDLTAPTLKEYREQPAFTYKG